jgi:ComF family protein
MPRTNFHRQKDNPVEKRFWGKADIFRATSFFFFQKGSPFQKLIHDLKYKGNKESGEVLGKYAAADLTENEDFCSVDIIVPVPLHPNKLRKRGYNQSEWIARGMAAVLQKPVDVQNLFRAIENPTQTKKSVYERFQNTEGIFQLKNPQLFENKHILIVDDVLTTGSTLEACALPMKNINGIKISLFTLAVA